MLDMTRKILQLPLINRILLSLGLIVCFFIIYYSIINDKESILNIQNPILSLSKQSKISPSQCHLSMKESDGWFCEFDSDWERRKIIHHTQHKRNRKTDGGAFFFQENWEPTIQCAFERRLGNTADGGKWVCDIHRFLEMNNENLLIYSFGSNGDFSFERAMKEQLFKAEIHTFDMGLYKCPDDICTFHQARLGNGKDNSSKSLQMIMNELGHQNRQIHILKVDIEGSEFSLFKELFQSSITNQNGVPYIRQILFEIHLGSDEAGRSGRHTHELFELLRSNNYAIFHKEPNLSNPSMLLNIHYYD